MNQSVASNNCRLLPLHSPTLLLY